MFYLNFHGTCQNAHFEKIRTSNTHNSYLMTEYFTLPKHNFTHLGRVDGWLGRTLYIYIYGTKTWSSPCLSLNGGRLSADTVLITKMYVFQILLAIMISYHLSGTRGRLNIKMSSFQYGDSHVKDKTVSPTVLSLTWESPYLGKTVFTLRQGSDDVIQNGWWNLQQWSVKHHRVVWEQSVASAQTLHLTAAKRWQESYVEFHPLGVWNILIMLIRKNNMSSWTKLVPHIWCSHISWKMQLEIYMCNIETNFNYWYLKRFIWN